MKERVGEGLIPAYLLLCLLLGGASAAGFWANMVLQLLAIPIILWALLWPSASLSEPARRLSILAGLAVALIAVQLIPLPPFLWTLLPGRGAIAEGYGLLGLELPWLPVSLAPYKTVASALWLLPAFAVLLGILRSDAVSRRRTAWTVPLVAAVSLPLGLLQVTAGSPLYIYEVSDFGLYTGLFANAAHLTMLLLAALPLLVGLYLAATSKRAGPAAPREKLFVLLALLAVMAGLILSASLAALGLSLSILVACLCMLLRRRKRISRLWAVPVAALALLYVGVASFTSFQNELVWNEAIGGTDSRHPAVATSIGAAIDFLPAGSGVGTFSDIYRRYEDVDAVGRLYVNHVHNDYVELVLETGLLGLALIVAFLLWWGRRAYAIWLSNESGPLARAATIATGAILVHSATGYPLRTAALGAVFAACCALMARPRGAKKERTQPDTKAARKARHLSAD